MLVKYTGGDRQSDQADNATKEPVQRKPSVRKVQDALEAATTPARRTFVGTTPGHPPTHGVGVSDATA